MTFKNGKFIRNIDVTLNNGRILLFIDGKLHKTQLIVPESESARFSPAVKFYPKLVKKG